MEKLIKRIQTCEKCILSQYRTKVVPGSGNPKAKILVIGEAPGEDEDLQGIPFIGKTGKMLRDSLFSFINEKDIFFSNSVMCRPINNSMRDEYISSCAENMWDIIYKLDPNIIIAVGTKAYSSIMVTPASNNMNFIKKDGRINYDVIMTTKTIPLNGHVVKVLPIFHPSYILRKNDSEHNEIWDNSMEYLKSELSEYSTNKKRGKF